mmetsp:Transcript_41346/g.118007  ORF Transcript_41346/g.118007 Transcript_41346/m.118007 type:complete len:244 (-) Transcript_41346:102-833(-)
MGNIDSAPHAMAAPRQHRVQLAATPLSPFVPTMPQAYHTSVIVDDVEYSFSPKGISSGRSFRSHLHLSGGPHTIEDLGRTSISGPQMVKALQTYFKEGTYDMLRKNCNSFSDCALFCLLGRRLDARYCEIEQIGTSADKHMALVQLLSLGGYVPNPKAASFRAADVIERIGQTGEDKENVFRHGHKVGQHVEVFSKMHHSWVGGTVRAVQHNGTITVLYNDGHHQKDVAAHDVGKVVRLCAGG